MSQRTTSNRAAAVRRAREAKAARDAERLLREQQIEQALVDFYEAVGAAEKIRQDAQRRAERILADAEDGARQADSAAGRAVRTLRGLEQTNAEISELCGISIAIVRAMANEAGAEPERAGEHGTAVTGEHDGAADGGAAETYQGWEAGHQAGGAVWT